MHNSHVVLIIADDAAFLRDLLARWQLERIVPGFTVMSTELFNGKATSSMITNKFSMEIFSLSIQYLTAFPLRFMKVVGQMQINILPFHFNSAV